MDLFLIVNVIIAIAIYKVTVNFTIWSLKKMISTMVLKAVKEGNMTPKEAAQILDRVGRD